MDRPNRRATDGGPGDSPRARQGRLVRHISSDPVLRDWLATSKARTLYRVAAGLVDEGHPAAAEQVRAFADGLASGDVDPFG